MRRRSAALIAAIAAAALAGPIATPAPIPVAPEAVEQAVETLRRLPHEQRLEAARRIELPPAPSAPEPRHPLLRLLNMTNWWELPWFLIGLTGQLAFFARMAVQWIASERRRESVVPPVFWWLSLVGAVFLTTYGVWRRDVVIILGQALGVFIYARNLWLIRACTSARSRA